MDVTENDPSLISCLETGKNGLFLDLTFPSGDPDADFCVGGKGPFSRTLPARIKTDGDEVIQRVLLVWQRDRYDTPDALLTVNNITVERAWQDAFAFHQGTGHAQSPIFFRHQVDPTGEFRPFKPLFRCNETRRWFHPVCPQCGLTLTLCRDDALLGQRGLPAFSDSLARFLTCGACARSSAAFPFYTLEKSPGLPDVVLDAAGLIAHWKQLPAHLAGQVNLPCRGCPDAEKCYGPDGLASERIVPVSFFPFYMMMFPAPSVGAGEFLRMISGGDSPTQPPGPHPFLFQDTDRQFLEVLYLKLTFLGQVYRQLMPAAGTTGLQDVDLSLDGIGVDLSPAGAGLPAYWNFSARIIDAVGSFQTSPFAPMIPEAPRLHFMGAVWFRALLANSRQRADAVYAEVARLLGKMDLAGRVATVEMDTGDPAGVFSGNQIFWSPEARDLPQNGETYWKQAMRLGLQLVHTGLKTGVAWNSDHFQESLDRLRTQIKDEMFAGPVAAAAGKAKTESSDTIGRLLQGILDKWRAQTDAAESQPAPIMTPAHPDIEEPVGSSSAMETPPHFPDNGQLTADDIHAPEPSALPPAPPAGDGWEQDLDSQETVVFSPPEASSPSDNATWGEPAPQTQEPQWNEDMEATVVLRTESAPPAPGLSPPGEDMDRTVVMSAPPKPPVSPPPGEDADLAATMIQNAPGGPPAPSVDESDLEATVVLNTGGGPVPRQAAPPDEDDLAATMVQGTVGRQAETAKWPDTPGPPPLTGPATQDRSFDEDDQEATVIISPAKHRPPPHRSPDREPVPAEDPLAATLIETPRRTASPGTARAGTHHAPPMPPIPPQPPGAPPRAAHPQVPARKVSNPEDDDDDIMEQTIIIRSGIKKE